MHEGVAAARIGCRTRRHAFLALGGGHLLDTIGHRTAVGDGALARDGVDFDSRVRDGANRLLPVGVNDAHNAHDITFAVFFRNGNRSKRRISQN